MGNTLYIVHIYTIQGWNRIYDLIMYIMYMKSFDVNQGLINNYLAIAKLLCCIISVRGSFIASIKPWYVIKQACLSLKTLRKFAEIR